MPVVEVTLLRLKGVAPDDPVLLQSLSSVRAILKTQSEFYSCIDDPTLLFILGLWPTLEAHRAFLASPRAAEVLGPQESMLEFKWAVHMELDAMDSLPLEAPVMAITRRRVGDKDVEAYHKALALEKVAVGEASRFKAVDGWRVDAAPGAHEALLFTGWDTTQAHATFSARQTSRLDHHDAATSASYDTLETHWARNLERASTGRPL